MRKKVIRAKKLKKGNQFIQLKSLWTIETKPELQSDGRIGMVISISEMDGKKHFLNKTFDPLDFVTLSIKT